ncbi:MAG: hypothetical protein DRP09_09015 [Candidatus Thorarchaeota archaeon]|nr:MAG: hypothetical protein DRP09_09015 [Candidatus Thorarchaeota archaeon]
MLYEKLCRLAVKTPFFNRLGTRKENRELTRAVHFLAPLATLTPEGVMTGGYLYGFLAFVAVFSVLYLFQIGIVLSVPLALMFSVVVYYIFVQYPISAMNSYRLGLAEEADLVYEQFILVFQSGGTIFDAIEMIAQSGHPFLSLVFQKMLGDIRRGTPPETCLREFAMNQPSDDIRRYFTAILTSLEQKTDLLEALSGESFDADMSLRQKNLELESRLLVVAALATYLPIIFTLAVALGGHATNPVILLIAPLFIAITYVLSRRFSKQFSAYFDRPRDTSVVGPTQREIMNEYEEFLNFLMLLGERLSYGDTLEVSLAEIREDLEPEIGRVVDVALRGIYQERISSVEALERASQAALGQRVSNMFRIISAMCEVSAQDAGERLTKIATRLVKRSALAKERDSIIAAQRMKVYLLTFTSAGVLGMLASLSPFLFLGALLSGGFTVAPEVLSVIEVAPLLIALAITTFSTGYLNTRMVGGARPLLVAVVNMLLFWTSFMASSGLMGIRLY